MNYTLLIISYYYFLSVNAIKPKFCIKCKFFQKDIFTINKFGKCELFPTDKEINYSYLVDGKKDRITDYTYCSIARKFDNMCGPEAKFYEKK